MGGPARIPQRRLAAPGGVARVRARPRAAREGVRVTGRPSPYVRPRDSSRRGRRSPARAVVRVDRRGRRARRTLWHQGGRERSAAGCGSRTSRPLPRRARAIRRGQLVTAASRPHIAPALVLGASVLLVFPEAPVWCSVAALACVAWRIGVARGRLRQPAPSLPLKIVVAAVTALCVVAVMLSFRTLNGLAAGTALL